MKKIKLLLLCLCIVLLSGCSAKYNVKITDKGKVTETLVLTFNNSEVEAGDVSAFLDDAIKSNKASGLYDGYNFIKNVGKTTSTLTIKKTYKTVQSYVDDSKILKTAYSSTSYIDDYGTYGIATLGDFDNENVFATSVVGDPIIDKLDVTFQLYNKITETNSTNFNEDKNTMSWSFTDSSENQGINFYYNNSKRYDIIIKEYIKTNIASIITIIVLVIGVLFVTFTIMKKNAQNNKI